MLYEVITLPLFCDKGPGVRRMEIYGFAQFGYEGELVKVESDLRRGIPAIDVVGLPDGAIRESRERMRAAIRNSGLEFPKERILLNLCPAGLKKEGSSFDLPIALSVLGSAEGLSGGTGTIMVLGELELSRITSYNVCYTKLLRLAHSDQSRRQGPLGPAGLAFLRAALRIRNAQRRYVHRLLEAHRERSPRGFRENESPVITSYSIHYTKLYEARHSRLLCALSRRGMGIGIRGEGSVSVGGFVETYPGPYVVVRLSELFPE